MKKIFITICLTFAMLLSSCGSDYAATAGGRKISGGELNFYLSSIKSQMIGTELASDEDWQNQEIEGMKAIDFAKERALETAADNVAYIAVSKHLGIELSEDDKTRIKNIKESLVRQYGGENGYKSFLKAQNLDDSFIDMLCESMVYSEILAARAVEQNPITDEERLTEFEKLSADSAYKAKHILILTVDEQTRQPLSEEEQLAAKSKAEDLYKQVQNGANFDALMNEYSQDPGLETNPDGYTFGAGEMVPEFENCVAGLKDNELGFTKSDFGYHIIKRLPVEMKDFADEIDATLKQQRLNNAMSDWKTEAGFTVVKNDSVFDSIS